ncbi:NAD(P)-binding protein [Glonium stellatum]|uniref:NAD(P)-binding protein n=1 Tax=Glonium stellatum TaxID=574774 RepID=A0A8E2F4A0_9PEZI|nr:NAD(P)-binding protein [Glonium stellatum]
MATPYILLTGATGNVGAVILEHLIAANQSVNAVLRSFAKSKAFLEAKYPSAITAGTLTFTEIPDLAAPGAFHAPAANASNIIHVATPLAYSDFQNAMIEPAWKFDHNILAAASASPSVKRVVITGSTVSTMRIPHDVVTGKTFTEANYNPITLEEALANPSSAYQYSKTMSEQKSWAYMAETKPHFDLVFLLVPLVTGRSPEQGYAPPSRERMGGIALVSRFLFDGKERSLYFAYFMDVDDVARVHIKALDPSVPGNERYLLHSGLLHLNEYANRLREKYPELRDRIAPGKEDEGFPEQMSKFDVSKMEKVFGTQWVDGFESVEAIVKDALAYEATH